MTKCLLTALGCLCLSLGAPLEASAQSPSSTPQPEPYIRLGGALRTTYRYDYTRASDRQGGGRWAYDVLRLNVDAAYKSLLVKADYRLYASSSGGPMLKYGWIGYKPGARHLWQIGVVQPAFGLNPSSSNNFYMNLDYYLGYDDDADLGIRYTYEDRGWMLSAAFMKNDEMPGNTPTSASRFGYDIGGGHRERNQLNLYVHKEWGSGVRHQIGLSGMHSGLYNISTHEGGRRYALSAHYRLRYKGLTLSGQMTQYDTKALEGGKRLDAITMAAFGGEHLVAASGRYYIASASYTLPVRHSLVDELHFYNDLSILDKHKGDSYTHRLSVQNVTGCMITAGPIISYVEWIWTRNHPFIGRNTALSMVSQGDNRFSGMVMINIGYYF